MAGSDTTVRIYHGPLRWFRSEVAKAGAEDIKSFTTLVHEWSDHLSTVRVHHTSEDFDPEELKGLPPLAPAEHVCAESRDYASAKGHVMTNFNGFIQTTGPKNLYLQNPPAEVQEQVLLAYPNTKVASYPYPTVKLATLRAFRDQYAGRIVGQTQVKSRILAGLYSLTDPANDRPVVFMFYGPSGVGKTETAQFLNELLGGKLLRKQFSMFQNDQFASYIFGGDHSEPSFARDLLERESGVVLIDEFDKAHPVFHNVFYELFDGGTFVDRTYKVDVGPAVIICTSNYATADAVRDALGEALYSRFDAVIEFVQLSDEEITEVIGRIVDERFQRLNAGEIATLDQDAIRNAFVAALAGSAGNVRQLRKLVNEGISGLLVELALADAPNDEPPPDTADVRSETLFHPEGE